jgi:hypothetical protein
MMAETSNHCKLLVVLLHDGAFNNHIDFLAQRGCVYHLKITTF